MRRFRALAFLLLYLPASGAWAVTDAEREVLARIAKELQMVDNLIVDAQRQADPDDRFQMDYKALRRDLDTVRRGVTEPMQDQLFEPRKFTPLQGEYLR